MKTILLIDGENFRHKVETILKNNGRRQKLFTAELLEKVFEESLPFKKYNIVEKRYYCAKIRLYQETKKQSLKLIAEQRRLKTFLEKAGYNVVVAGNVRMSKSYNGKLDFKEKGVDVKLAVDLVSIAYEKFVDRVILCSSDSDLQPAIEQGRLKGLEVVYCGFESSVNKGLIFTTDKKVLIPDSVILESLI